MTIEKTEEKTALEAETTVRLGCGGHVKVDALGLTIEKGRLYWCRPDSEDSVESGEDEATGEITSWGFHGTDTPPCEAAFAADEPGGHGYLVIADEDGESPECVDGWTCEPAGLDVGWTADDGTASVTVVRVHRDGVYTIAGYCR